METQIHAVADPWASVGLLDVSTTKKQPKLGPEIPAGQQTGLTEGLVLRYRSLTQNSEPEFLHLYTAVTGWEPASRCNQPADVSFYNAAIDKDKSAAKGREVVLSLFFCGNHKFMQTNKQKTVFSQRQMMTVFSFQGGWCFSSLHLQLTGSVVMSFRSQWRRVRMVSFQPAVLLVSLFLVYVAPTRENQKPHQWWGRQIPPGQTCWRQLGTFLWWQVGPFLVFSANGDGYRHCGNVSLGNQPADCTLDPEFWGSAPPGSPFFEPVWQRAWPH